MRGAAFGLLARIVAALAVFSFGVMLANVLGASDSGLFYLALALVSVLASLSRAGLDGSVIRFVATHLSRNENEMAGAIYLRTVVFVGVVALLAGFALNLGADLLAARLFSKPELADALGGMSWVLLPMALFMLHGQFLQAERFVGAAVLVQTALLPLVMTLVLVVAPPQWGLSETVWTYFGATLLTLLTAVMLIRRYSACRPVARTAYDYRELIASARSLAVADLVNKIILPWSPVILLGLWSTAASVGLFAAANRLAVLVVFACEPVNRMLAPQMAVLWSEGEQASFFRLSRQAALLMIGASLPVALVLFIVPQTLLALFGPEFVDAGLMVVILAAAQLFNALTGPVRSMLIMTGNERDHRLSCVASGVVMVLLCVALIPELHGVGAALATAAALVVNNVVAAWLVWHRLGVVPLLGRKELQ